MIFIIIMYLIFKLVLNKMPQWSFSQPKKKLKKNPPLESCNITFSLNYIIDSSKLPYTNTIITNT